MWLAHHGILGMKWGVRRYQNKDGSLTSAGRKRYMNKPFEDNRRLKGAFETYNSIYWLEYWYGDVLRNDLKKTKLEDKALLSLEKKAVNILNKEYNKELKNVLLKDLVDGIIKKESDVDKIYDAMKWTDETQYTNKTYYRAL